MQRQSRASKHSEAPPSGAGRKPQAAAKKYFRLFRLLRPPAGPPASQAAGQTPRSVTAAPATSCVCVRVFPGQAAAWPHCEREPGRLGRRNSIHLASVFASQHLLTQQQARHANKGRRPISASQESGRRELGCYFNSDRPPRSPAKPGRWHARLLPPPGAVFATGQPASQRACWLLAATRKRRAETIIFPSPGQCHPLRALFGPCLQLGRTCLPAGPGLGQASAAGWPVIQLAPVAGRELAPGARANKAAAAATWCHQSACLGSLQAAPPLLPFSSLPQPAPETKRARQISLPLPLPAGAKARLRAGERFLESAQARAQGPARCWRRLFSSLASL